MPITYETDSAMLEGRCPAEEADALLDWLRTARDPIVHLEDCTDLHTAVFQLLLASRVRIILPRDPLLAGCLTAAGIGVLVPDSSVAVETAALGASHDRRDAISHVVQV